MMNIDFELEQVSERTVAVIEEQLYSNAGAVALKNFIVAIDPTMKPTAAKILRQKLEKHFQLPVKFLQITHYHGDHVLGTAPFKDTCIIGSNVFVQNMRESIKTRWTPEAFEKWKQDNPEDTDWIDEVELLLPGVSFQEKLEIHDEDLVVELYHAGGHTSCSSFAYVPHEKVLFAGDLMFAQSFPYAGDPTCDPDRWIRVFKQFLTFDFEKLIPGHGPVVGKMEVEKHLHFFEALKEATKEAILAEKGVDDIQVPEFYAAPEEDAWIKTETLKHWYTFYKTEEQTHYSH